MVLAIERKEGLLALKRALPMPPAAYLVAKMLMAMMFNAIVIAILIAAALLIGHVNLGAAQFFKVWLFSIVGSLPFAALGLSVGVRASGRSAPAIVNFIYMPLMFLAGLFFPIPHSIHWMTYISPAFYVDELLAHAADLPVAGNLLMYAILLAGFTLVLTASSVRRLARVG
jgi:ABC-2 type transport system permease protein